MYSPSDAGGGPQRGVARPRLEVLVCTHGARATGLARRLPAPLPGVGYLVCHQAPVEGGSAAAELLARGDVRYLRFDDRGLARNRNHGLRHARGAICLVADDDLELLSGWQATVLSAFEAHPEATFATFALLRGDGVPHRRYPDHAVPHGRLSLFGVVSCELAFDLDRVRHFGVGFNEHLGIGTSIGRGEEGVFLRDLVACGATGWCVPTPIARHAAPTTGDRAMAALGPAEVRALGSVSFCKWGRFAYAMSVKESLRLALRCGRPASAPAFLAAFRQGIADARRLGLERISFLASRC